LVSGVVVFPACLQWQRGFFGQLLELGRSESGGEVVDCLEWSGGGCDEVAHPDCQLRGRAGAINSLHSVHWRAWRELHIGFVVLMGKVKEYLGGIESTWSRSGIIG